ncbi:hypothetical protein AAV99_07445 [Aurantiacibacter marinus]|uniref:Uncharacterized protein n=1 Tax=Aurantiacibacter marinus TaxID=874156 RepID=A0A0H0XNI1_9SPHN|nr:hypothetical protein AAV99_07445 [Aurantiacibacter marinus]
MTAARALDTPSATICRAPHTRDLYEGPHIAMLRKRPTKRGLPGGDEQRRTAYRRVSPALAFVKDGEPVVVMRGLERHGRTRCWLKRSA